MHLSREPTDNERRYVLSRARRGPSGARIGGIILLLIALGVAALLVTVAVLDEEVPLQLAAAAVGAGLLGVYLVVLSRAPRGKRVVVVAIDGEYQEHDEGFGPSAETFHRIGGVRVELPLHWIRRLVGGRTYHAELGLLAASVEGEPGAEQTMLIPGNPSAALLSLDGRYCIDREVELGLLRIRFPLSFLAAFFSLIFTAVTTAVVVHQEDGDSLLGRLVSIVHRAVDLRDQPPYAATAAVALAVLTVLLGLRVAWVIRRNHAILRRLTADDPIGPGR